MIPTPGRVSCFFMRIIIEMQQGNIKIIQGNAVVQTAPAFTVQNSRFVY